MNKQLLACLSCAVVVCADVAVAQEDPKDIVATAVRQNGHQCDNPQSAEPDPEHSAPDQKAWIIRCENASYRVKFMGDTGTVVEPISE